MKKLVFSLLTFLATMSHGGTILSIAADEWFPMNGDPESPTPGYMIELAKTIFEPQGIEVQYTLVPWERAVTQTREGKYNCVVGAYKSDTPDFVFPKTSWGLDEPKFFILNSYSWQFDGNIESLKVRNLGVIEGYTYRDDFDAYVQDTKGIHVQVTGGNQALETNIKKLLAKRIDTLVESESVFKAKIKELKLEGKFKSAGNIIDPVDMYLACSPRLPASQTYVDMVDQAMPKLRTSGKLQAILKRYGLKDWQ